MILSHNFNQLPLLIFKKLKNFFTYISYFENNNFESIGVTNCLQRRLKLLNQLSDKKVKLVYFEEYDNSKTATAREQFLKELHSKLLSELIIENNPMLTDLLEII